MSEELNKDNLEGQNDNGQQGTDTNVQSGTEEKTFKQEDVDRIVADRLVRERKKYADYDFIKAELEKAKGDSTVLKDISEVLNVANFSGTPAEQAKALRQAYGLTEKQAVQVVNASNEQKADKQTTASVDAILFEKSASDDDVVDEVENILAKPIQYRTDEDKAKLKVLKQRYGNIMYNHDKEEAAKIYDGDIDKLLGSKEFNEFAEGMNLPINKIVAKYLKYTGAKEDKKEPSNPGSVKDTSGVAEKEYYTKDEVDKLTEKDLENPKIWEKVRKSMTKWK